MTQQQLDLEQHPVDAARHQVCQPCRQGHHTDHHTGLWARVDGSDPTVCPCVRCGGLAHQRASYDRMQAVIRARAGYTCPVCAGVSRIDSFCPTHGWFIRRSTTDRANAPERRPNP